MKVLLLSFFCQRMKMKPFLIAMQGQDSYDFVTTLCLCYTSVLSFFHNTCNTYKSLLVETINKLIKLKMHKNHEYNDIMG